MRTALPPRIAWLIIVLAAAFVSAPAQSVFDPDSLLVMGPVSLEQQNTLRSRQLLIKDEVSNSTNEWAGQYFAEDSPVSGTQLVWAPTNGFVVWWTSCAHGWHDRVNFGDADLREGVLRTSPELAGDGQKVFTLPGELIPVKWGDQHYLVPVDQLIAFCYAARNADRSLEIKEFFLKDADRDKRHFGLPSVPPAYRKYLTGPPIQAKIVKLTVQPWGEVFTLNAGRTAGVGPGMKFFALTPRNVYVLMEVGKVHEDTSDAYVITVGFKNRSGGTVKPRVGWRVTSRAPRRAYEYFPG